MRRLLQKFRAVKSAMQAGWIASSCARENPVFHCEIDDVNECITPCYRHADRIAELATVNEENPW